MAVSKYTSGSWQGIERDSNKDDILTLEHGDMSLYVVFDGVSTTIDARALIGIVKEYISSHLDDLEKRSIAEIFYEANNYALKENIGDGATTYVALLLNAKENTQTISWLGDSRIYGFVKDAQVIKKLTNDHCVPDEPNVITRGLGFEDMEREDFEEKEIDVEYEYLLCTDGFYEFFEEDGEDMLDILLLKSPTEIKEAFETVVKGSNADDATYIVV